jgi:hypothetical protein
VINEIEEYELFSDAQNVIRDEEAKIEETPLASNPNLIDHSGRLHNDFSTFLFNE